MPDFIKRLSFASKFAAFTAALTLGASLILLLASHQANRHLLRDSSAPFGDALARQLAAMSVGPLLQGDRISLQAMVRELAANQAVRRAAIYDLDNQPIVEAGEVDRNSWDHSASITLENSIAGYAVLSIDPSGFNQRVAALSRQLALLVALMTALAYALASLPGRRLESWLRQLGARLANPAVKLPRYRGRDQLATLIDTVRHTPVQLPPAGDEHSTRALLYLSVDPDPAAAAEQLRLVAAVCNLYNADIDVCRRRAICARFAPTRDDDQDYCFRALCSAFLLHRLARAPQPATLGLLEPSPGDARFHYQAAIDELDTANRDQDRDRIALQPGFARRPAISERCTLTTDAEHTYLDAIRSPYDALLARQLDKLQQQLCEQPAAAGEEGEVVD